VKSCLPSSLAEQAGMAQLFFLARNLPASELASRQGRKTQASRLKSGKYRCPGLPGLTQRAGKTRLPNRQGGQGASQKSQILGWRTYKLLLGQLFEAVPANAINFRGSRGSQVL